VGEFEWVLQAADRMRNRDVLIPLLEAPMKRRTVRVWVTRRWTYAFQSLTGGIV